MNNFCLDFITKENFEKHVLGTIENYGETLKSIDLAKFNSNIIDPIKLLFDKNIFRMGFEEIIRLELQRQRDKTNSNTIGYFHQNIFRYLDGCEVPKEVWDVIYRSPEGQNYYVEMKNKHNTMNSSSAAKTYMKFQSHLLNSIDRENSVCALVEVLVPQSRDIPWIISIDKKRQISNSKLRRISIDRFYSIVTGDSDAFKKLCYQLPITINELLAKNILPLVEEDTVISSLKEIDQDYLNALYKLVFSSYEGFSF